MNKHNGSPIDRNIDKKTVTVMEPSAALSGIEFHALASRGLIENIRKTMATDQSMDDVNLAAEQVAAAYRVFYIAMKSLNKSHELGLLEVRKAEIQAA